MLERIFLFLGLIWISPAVACASSSNSQGMAKRQSCLATFGSSFETNPALSHPPKFPVASRAENLDFLFWKPLGDSEAVSFRQSQRMLSFRRSIDVSHDCDASVEISVRAVDIMRSADGLIQKIRADAFRGDRLEFSGYLKCKEVSGASGLCMTVDGKFEPLASDDMSSRSISGTRDWTYCCIVLDVPRDAESITFGPRLRGKGTVWVSGVNDHRKRHHSIVEKCTTCDA